MGPCVIVGFIVLTIYFDIQIIKPKFIILLISYYLPLYILLIKIQIHKNLTVGIGVFHHCSLAKWNICANILLMQFLPCYNHSMKTLSFFFLEHKSWKFIYEIQYILFHLKLHSFILSEINRGIHFWDTRVADFINLQRHSSKKEKRSPTIREPKQSEA